MMMAVSAPMWRAVVGCPPQPLALSHPQANPSQSEGRRGEGPEENQHLIGDGLTDWMTEEVDFSSYLPPPHSSPSPNASLPPSPLQQDIQVPSDLEVMTSLLQEELAQLEDYFLSDPLPEKTSKMAKCDKGTTLVPVGPPPYYPLPYASYATPNPPESGPLLVTLATGELDLLSFCGGPIGRSKIPRHTPYSCGRPSVNTNIRKRVSEGLRVADNYESSMWSSKGSCSGSPALANGYSCVEDERVVGKGYCLGSAVEIRRCAILPKEEKSCRYVEESMGGGGGKMIASGYSFTGSIEGPHKKEEMLMYGVREHSASGMGVNDEAAIVSEGKNHGEAAKTNSNSWKSESGDGCFLQGSAQVEAYHSFLGAMSEPSKTEAMALGLRQHSDFHCTYLEGQGTDCLAGDRATPALLSSGERLGCGLKEDTCSLAGDLDGLPMEMVHGERKQKKRDQNKTAAHRYRQRKRAELDALEDQLHGLEGRNRELRDKAESVEREIQYVKDLLIEVYKARSQRLKQEVSA